MCMVYIYLYCIYTKFFFRSDLEKTFLRYEDLKGGMKISVRIFAELIQESVCVCVCVCCVCVCVYQ